MSRLDDHVGAVQNKLAVRQFVEAAALASIAVAGALLIGTLVDRLFAVHPPKPLYWIYGAIGAMLAYAAVTAIRRRPDAKTAAVAIDQRLGLKEKISTALYLRQSDDPFAQAALKDAETTAAGVAVDLRKHFPLAWPRQTRWTAALLIATALAAWLISPLDLLGHKEQQRQQLAQQAQTEAAKQNVEKALAAVEAIPKTAAADENLKIAKSDLQALLQKPITDPSSANRTASKALQDAKQAITEQIKSSSKFAQAQNDMKAMKSLQTSPDAQGPVADAQRDMAKGDFQSALDQLDDAVKNFDHTDPAKQQDTAKQMQQLAQQLQQMSKDPAQQQKMQDQLKQMGLNQQQAQQAQQLLQQAAQGDKQAQQQLQQMAQQQLAQMNNGKGPTQQQQQQMQKLMQQVQTQANTQQQAQQMSQAAQQMAQAMQQAQQAQQQQQQGGQKGQPKSPQQQQQMQQAMAQMQQQLGQMQAQQQDAQQIAAAQQAAQQAGQQASDQAQRGQQQPGQGQNGQGQQAGQGQGQQGGGQQPGNQPGQWAQGNAGNQQKPGQGNNNGQAGGGQGAGDRTFKTQAPYTVKTEVSPSQEDEKGRILASTFIKDNKPTKGDSAASLQDVAQAAEQDKTDEIDSERISRSAQSAVKNYFNSMQNGQ